MINFHPFEMFITFFTFIVHGILYEQRFLRPLGGILGVVRNRRAQYQELW